MVLDTVDRGQAGGRAHAVRRSLAPSYACPAPAVPGGRPGRKTASGPGRRCQRAGQPRGHAADAELRPEPVAVAGRRGIAGGRSDRLRGLGHARIRAGGHRGPGLADEQDRAAVVPAGPAGLEQRCPVPRGFGPPLQGRSGPGSQRPPYEEDQRDVVHGGECHEDEGGVRGKHLFRLQPKRKAFCAPAPAVPLGGPAAVPVRNLAAERDGRRAAVAGPARRGCLPPALAAPGPRTGPRPGHRAAAGDPGGARVPA